MLKYEKYIQDGGKGKTAHGGPSWIIGSSLLHDPPQSVVATNWDVVLISTISLQGITTDFPATYIKETEKLRNKIKMEDTLVSNIDWIEGQKRTWVSQEILGRKD